MANAKKLSDVNIKDYDAIFYVGGHGPVIDLAFDDVNAKLASDVSQHSIPIRLTADPSCRLGKRERLSPLFAMDLRKPIPFHAHSELTSSFKLYSALVKAVDSDGKSIFSGKSFTGFSNVEEELFGTVKEIPFSLEDKITGELGGRFEKASEPWAVSVIIWSCNAPQYLT